MGTTLGPSRIWVTIGRGIVNEVYYPRIDSLQIRDLGFLVADNKGFWVEVKRIEDCTVEFAYAGARGHDRAYASTIRIHPAHRSGTETRRGPD